MRSYTDPPKWLLSSDAQLTKMRAYVENLPQEWEWMWLLPEQWQSEGFDNFGGPGSNVFRAEVSAMDNVLEQRFHFPMGEMSEWYRDFKPDVLLCEVPEHVRAWRAVQDRVGHRCPIVAMVEHVDFYEETHTAARVPFLLRQLDGALSSDKLVFPLESMKVEWYRAAQKIVKPQPIFPESVRVWPGLFSPNEVDEQRENGLALKPDVPVIFLISRLSDGTRTRYEEIIGASNDLLRQGVEHVLWVANPNEAKEWQWIRSSSRAYEPHPFGERRLKRDEYLQLLWAADVVPIMYDLSRIYSVGACEAVAALNLLVSAPGTPNWAAVHAPGRGTAEIAAALEVAVGMLEMRPIGYRDLLLRQHGIEQNVDVVKKTLEELIAC